mgnify:FL=1
MVLDSGSFIYILDCYTPMNFYKFKDTIDGNHAFILAQSESEAWAELNRITALKCRLVETRNPEDLKKPVVILNQILPF